MVGGRPGGIEAGRDISGASYCNYLNYADAWWQLSDEAWRRFRESLPIQRSAAQEPGSQRPEDIQGMSEDAELFEPTVEYPDPVAQEL